MARREDNIKALKIGVNLDRKAIVLDYSVPGGAFPSKRRRFMPVAGESASDIVRSLRSRHAKYLVGVRDDTLMKMADWFLEQTSKARTSKPASGPSQSAERPGHGVAKPRVELKQIVEDNVDLNKFEDDKLADVKDAMEKEFAMRAKAKGTAGFQYDVKKSFNPVEESGWDSSDSEPID
eukprot:m.89752 g.89752  ORF g.89752 m.89752 type:complete len:179 (+) comp11776_c0_seq3:541-1077(+)